MIERFLHNVEWVPDGMDYPRLNCWGLARLARHDIYGLPLLPRSDGITASDKRSLTRACGDVVARHLEQINTPRLGALATVWRGRLCVHVALVVEIENRLAILEVDQRIGCRWQRLHDWERRQTKVIYYHDRQN